MMDLTRLPVRVEPRTCVLSDLRLLEHVCLSQSTLSDDGTSLKALTLPFFKRGKAWLTITELIPTAAALGDEPRVSPRAVRAAASHPHVG